MAGQRFYSTREWRSLRSQVKAQWRRQGRPCAYCGKPLDWSARPIVDHIKPRRTHPTLAHEPSNLCVMHHECHTRKTAHQDYAKRPPISAAGFPAGSEWDDE